VYPGGVHGFTGMPNALGRKANAHADEWLKARLG
jgi:hypothetical protein